MLLCGSCNGISKIEIINLLLVLNYRYAFRDNMTDVIIQHLITEQKGMFVQAILLCCK